MKKGEAKYLAIFLGPAVLLYTTFVTYPLITSLVFSLYKWPGVGPMHFVGIKNFQMLFVGPYANELFNAFRHNLYFFGLNALLELGLGFLVALILATKLRGKGIFRALVYFPNTIPIVLVGFMWSLFLNPQIGLVNQFLRKAGLAWLAKPWLGDPQLALTTIVLVNVWRNLGFYVLVLLAAIQGIPADIIEAAYVDGANHWHLVLKIILPLTIPTFRTLALLLFVWSFNVFDLVYALTGVQAGPFRSTDVLGTLFYRTAFGGLGSSYVDMGLGAAVTVFIFAIVVPVSIAYVWLLERRQK